MNDQLYNDSTPSLITMILNNGQASKALRIARKNGASGGTIYLGHGTIPNKILQFFGWDQSEKEIVIIASTADTLDQIITALDKQFHFDQPNHGILFTKEIETVHSLVMHYDKNFNEQEYYLDRRNPSMYQEITVVIPRGMAEVAVEAARSVGAQGATIIHGRGAGTKETSRILGADIEPEKEIALILVENDIAQAVIEAIQSKLGISENGHGIIYTQAVSGVYGLPKQS